MMEQTLALLMAAVALFGTAIGLRFSVYILIPAGLAVLIVSVVAQLISTKMTGWGIQGTFGLLLLLNVGFALGLLLRAGAAYGSKRTIPRSGNIDQKLHRPDVAGREANGEGPTATISPRDLAKESFRR
jgi:hypothetical protein